jgi:Tol biopolymer transport system component
MQLTKLDASAYPLRWSPDSKRVLFVTTGNAPGIWSIATVGGEPQHILSLSESAVQNGAASVTVSADNKVAAFLSRADDGTWGVSTVVLPGGTPIKYPTEPYATKAIYNNPSLQFSPDGQQMILLLNRGEDGEEGWLLKYPQEGSSGVRRIEPALKSYAGTPTASWMPDNRHVVMSLQPTPYGSQQLWLVDTQSSDRHALTSSTKDAFEPGVAPGGDRLVFRELNGNFDVVSMDLATGAAAPLIATERNEAMPAWAAASPAMVYVGNRNGPDEIWFRRDGIPDRPIVTPRDFPTDSTLWFMAPVLSPNGERVIYTRVERAGVGRLWISAVAGGSPIRATSDNQSGAEFAGSWSPDGTWFVYIAVVGDKLNLMKIQTNGEAAPIVIKAGIPPEELLPDWSPAGDWIVLGGLLISPDGKTEHAIRTPPSPHYVFSKDGKRLYGLRPEDGRQTLFSIDVPSGTERTIASGITFEPGSYLSPSIRLSLAPDGKSVVFGTGRIRYDLWMLEGFKAPDSLAARLGFRQ